MFIIGVDVVVFFNFNLLLLLLCEHNLFNVVVLIAEINVYYYYLYLNVREFGGWWPPILK